MDTTPSFTFSTASVIPLVTFTSTLDTVISCDTPPSESVSVVPSSASCPQPTSAIEAIDTAKNFLMYFVFISYTPKV